MTLSRKGLSFKIEFSTRRAAKRIVWHQSKRLRTGGLVALSPAKNSFRGVCIIATVVARPPRELEVEFPQKPSVFLDISNVDDADFDPQLEWVMVEAENGYWEGYRHALKAMQKMPGES